MKEKYVNEIEQIFKDRYSNTCYPINHGYYLWIYRKSNDEAILIIHGKGIPGYPYEVILLKTTGNPTKREFTKWIDFKKYLKNDIMDDLMVGEI